MTPLQMIDLLQRGVAGGHGSNTLKVSLPDGRQLDVADVAIERDRGDTSAQALAFVVIVVRA